MKLIEKIANDHIEQAHVCMALWEAGFDGPQSAERRPIMNAANNKAREAYLAGFRKCREIATKIASDSVDENARTGPLICDLIAAICESEA